MNETNLNAEIEYEFEELAKTEFGSKAYQIGVDGVTKLLDRAIEYKKLDAEKDRLAEEAQVKAEQLKDEKNNRLVNNILTGAGIVLPLTVAVWGAVMSFKIEFRDNEIVSSTVGRKFIDRILSGKK